MMTRRMLLAGGAIGLALAAANPWRPGRSRAGESFPVMRSDAEWRARLTPEQYAVLRESDTEYPFTSDLLHEKRRGTFACAGCARPLFSSETKYDSGTGWPSFWAPLDAGVATTEDSTFGMVHTAVHCAGCGGHQGHLFDDGPKPTGLRYCINGVALAFVPAAA